MAKLIALYKKPADPAAFDRYYYDVHVPIAKEIPGLRSYEVTRGPIVTLDGLAPYHLIAMLTFDSVNAIQSALASEEGKATAADLGRFAEAGVDIYIVDTKTL
jgi:uncharacterized protein (TIGR02118 family)